jgi:ABC-type Mn2+/Zn2+ transport system permease subunit
MSAPGKRYFTVVISPRIRLFSGFGLLSLLLAAILFAWGISFWKLSSHTTGDTVLEVAFSASFFLGFTLLFCFLLSYASDNYDPRRRPWWMQ